KRVGEAVEVFVSPALIARENFLAGIDGAINAICFKAKKSGGSRGERDCDYFLVGPRAGGGPPPFAVLGDVCELARGEGRFAGLPSLVPEGTLKLQPAEEITGSFYVRFIVKDRAGIVGDIGQTFGHLAVNISEIWQLRHSGEELRALAE